MKIVLHTYIPFFCLFLCGFLPQSNAQNLAPNPSFEEYNNCPSIYTVGFGFFGLPEPTVRHWGLPTEGSSDYFNACVDTAADALWWASVPDNGLGSQVPRTGNAYVGGIFAHDVPFLPDYREYIECRLLEPLPAGHRCYVSYWINAADGTGATPRLNIDQFGAYFSSTAYLDAASRTVLPLIPQVSSPVGRLYLDKESWEEVSGIFTTAGGEEYMILGTFPVYSSLTVDSSEFPSTLWDFINPLAYYFLDDVCVLDLDGDAMETSFEQKIICKNDSVMIQGRPGYRYLWNDGLTSASRFIATNGSYWVKSIDTAVCSGFYLDSFEITIGKVSLDLDIGNDTTLCSGKTLILDARRDELNAYLWSTGAMESTVEVSEPGKYYVYAEGPCHFSSDTIIVSLFREAVLEEIDDKIICAGEQVWLRYPQAEFSYYWNTGESGCCIEVAETGAYVIEASDECGNRQSDTVNVFSMACGDCFLVPNAFTPNSDGVNDQFKPLSQCLFGSYRMSIYDRWGQRIFVSYRPEDGWDGMIQGRPADVGVYYYEIIGQPIIDRAPQSYVKGDITLLR